MLLKLILWTIKTHGYGYLWTVKQVYVNNRDHKTAIVETAITK